MLRRVDSPAGRVTFTKGKTRENGISLNMDGTCQSYVDLNDPQYMHLDYLASIAEIVDDLTDGNESPQVVHIGGGALALPRRIQDSKPDATQWVFEPNSQMLEALFELAPLRDGHNIEVIEDFGEVGIKKLEDDSADIVVLDAYVGSDIPVGLTTEDFFNSVRRVLRPGGSLVINVVELSPGLTRSNPLNELGHKILGTSFLSASKRMLAGTAAVGNVVVVATLTS